MCTQNSSTLCMRQRWVSGNFGNGWQRSWRHPGPSPLPVMERRSGFIFLLDRAETPPSLPFFARQRNNSTLSSQQAALLKTFLWTNSKKLAGAEKGQRFRQYEKTADPRSTGTSQTDSTSDCPEDRSGYLRNGMLYLLFGAYYRAALMECRSPRSPSAREHRRSCFRFTSEGRYRKRLVSSQPPPWRSRCPEHDRLSDVRRRSFSRSQIDWLVERLLEFSDKFVFSARLSTRHGERIGCFTPPRHSQGDVNSGCAAFRLCPLSFYPWRGSSFLCFVLHDSSCCNGCHLGDGRGDTICSVWAPISFSMADLPRMGGRCSIRNHQFFGDILWALHDCFAAGSRCV